MDLCFKLSLTAVTYFRNEDEQKKFFGFVI